MEEESGGSEKESKPLVTKTFDVIMRIHGDFVSKITAAEFAHKLKDLLEIDPEIEWVIPFKLSVESLHAKEVK
jgi:hypothetical protein